MPSSMESWNPFAQWDRKLLLIACAAVFALGLGVGLEFYGSPPAPAPPESGPATMPAGLVAARPARIPSEAPASIQEGGPLEAPAGSASARAAPPITFAQLMGALRVESSGTAAKRFAREFSASPPLRKLWERFQRDRDADGFVREVRKAPEFSRLVRSSSADPAFRALAERFANSPALAPRIRELTSEDAARAAGRSPEQARGASSLSMVVPMRAGAAGREQPVQSFGALSPLRGMRAAALGTEPSAAEAGEARETVAVDAIVAGGAALGGRGTGGAGPEETLGASQASGSSAVVSRARGSLGGGSGTSAAAGTSTNGLPALPSGSPAPPSGLSAPTGPSPMLPTPSSGRHK